MYKIYKKTYVEPVRKNGIPQSFDLMARIASEKKPHKAILLEVCETKKEAFKAWGFYKKLYKYIKRCSGGFCGDFWDAKVLELVTDKDSANILYSSDISEDLFTYDQFFPEQDPAELDKIAYEY